MLGREVLRETFKVPCPDETILQDALEIDDSDGGDGDGGPIQCDQIGRFLEFLSNKFYYKSSPNVW